MICIETYERKRVQAERGKLGREREKSEKALETRRFGFLMQKKPKKDPEM